MIKSTFSTKSVGVSMSILLLSLTVCAAAPSKPSVTAATPNAPAGKAKASSGDEWRVAKSIDDIIQPRFQRNAGQFGMDRVESFPSLDGHPHMDVFSDESRSEKERLSQIIGMKRPFVVAMLHCAHKPGAHTGKHDRGSNSRSVHPYTQPLAAAGTTDRQAKRFWDWTEENLDRVAVPFTKRVRHGDDVHTVYGKWAIEILPIRAKRGRCLTCHAGAKLGEPLGAMVYLVRQTPGKIKPNHYFTGDSTVE